MSKRLESYLENLRGRLVRHFEPKRLDEVIAEIRSHVTYSARDAQQELGMESDEAMRSALAALGPVETVAEDLVNQHRGGTAKSEWRVVRVPLVLYVIAFFILPILFLIGGYYQSMLPFTPIGKLIAFLPTMVLITFMIAVWRSRRWLLKPMCIGVLGCYVLGCAIQVVPGYRELLTSRSGVDAKFTQKRLAQIEGELRMVELGAKGYLESRDQFQAGTKQYFHPDRILNEASAPLGFLPFNVRIPMESSVSLIESDWDPKYAEHWTEFGTQYRDALIDERDELVQGRIRGHFAPWSTTAYFYGSQAGMLALANVAVLAASNRRRRRRVGRDPHLA